VGLIVVCGGQHLNKSAGKACRPLRRITTETPITIAELLRLHSKSDLVRTAKMKERDPSKRVLWKTLTVRSA